MNPYKNEKWIKKMNKKTKIKIKNEKWIKKIKN